MASCPEVGILFVAYELKKQGWQGFSTQCCRSLPIFSKTKAVKTGRGSRMLRRERGLRMRLRVRVPVRASVVFV
jgi:hypothetical protein